MELLIGGIAQGKLEYALMKYPDAVVVSDETECVDGTKIYVWKDLHSNTRKWLSEGKTPEEIWSLVQGVIQGCPSLVMICDEVGNGIVPMEKEERIWREETGRLLCKIAREAESVTRICCGLPVKIK
ncbi:MAG: bifunctional adenosylcobinamide kinase/adenosylcobinamide-phosphate guanylyltransferase [Lachnospiraceae bacterium]|nr:bifunctional adenosylcobinamide kinase/adenosylcobinamide-phosphate guanylyltransferase [Lachnospiraceae bacterium]